MSLGPLTDLSGDQVLRASFDESLQAIRTNVEATVVASGVQEVSIESTDDSVAIGNTAGSHFADVTASSALKVDTTLTGGSSATNQVAILGELTNLDTKLPNLNTTPIKTIQIFTLPFDSLTATYPTSTQEVYQSRVGGTSGAVQETVTINYTDASKDFILDVART